MDALVEIAKNPLVLAAAGVAAALAIVFEVRAALALTRLSKTLKPGEQLPSSAFRPLLVSSLFFTAAVFVLALGLS